MSDKEMVKLVRASDKAAKAKVQHIMLAITADGQVHLNGSTNLIQGITDQPGLFDMLKTNMKANQLEEGSDITPTGSLVYPLLPCSPYSNEWPGSKKVRNILTSMLTRGGYSKNGRNQALGSGVAPPGWPENVIPWANYKGACRSGLTSLQITDIIIQLLRGVDLDENTHVQQQEQEDDNVDNEEAEADDSEGEEGMNSIEGVNTETSIDSGEGEKIEQEGNYENKERNDEENREIIGDVKGAVNIEGAGQEFENNNDPKCANTIVIEVINEPASKIRNVGNN